MEQPSVYYSHYLQLDKILGAQKQLSQPVAHDEMLFIVIHQSYELWFKQILFEIDSVKELLKQNPIPDEMMYLVVSRLKRIVEIQSVLIEQMKIIETMTSIDFMDFRNFLIPASGFQSLQFRLLEIGLGLKSEDRSSVEKAFFNSRLSADDKSQLEQAEKRASLRDLIGQWLERFPFMNFKGFDFWQMFQQAVNEMLDSDQLLIKNNKTLSEEQRRFELLNLELTRKNYQTLFDQQKYQETLEKKQRRLSRPATLAALFINLHRDQPILSMPYELIKTLIEIDQNLTTWRYKHAIMVHRMLGTKIGTGGSSGQDYLKKTAEANRIFVDFFDIATFLIPRSKIPILPDKIKKDLGFIYQ